MGLEGGEAELDGDAAGRVSPVPQLGRDALRVSPQRGPELLVIRAVGAERLLGADRLGRAERLDRPVVASVRQVVEPVAVLAEPLGEHGPRRLLQLADRREAELAQLLRHHAADAPEPLDRQGAEESRLVSGRDDDEAVRLFEVGRHLGDELVGGEPRRRGQTGLGRGSAA